MVQCACLLLCLLSIAGKTPDAWRAYDGTGPTYVSDDDEDAEDKRKHTTTDESEEQELETKKAKAKKPLSQLIRPEMHVENSQEAAQSSSEDGRSRFTVGLAVTAGDSKKQGIISAVGHRIITVRFPDFTVEQLPYSQVALMSLERHVCLFPFVKSVSVQTPYT